MREPKISPLKECSFCHSGIGKDTYQSNVIPGQYCSSDCYSDALMKELKIDGLMGRFKLKTDGKGGVYLE